MIVITGAAGFIGSYLVSYFNQMGYDDIIIVDEFTRADKLQNLNHKRYDRLLDREEFLPWLSQNGAMVSAIIHLGARTDTTEMDRSIFDHLNLAYSKRIWQFCVAADVPLIYASSAATYGLGEFGYSDSHRIVPFLKPLNPYGDSKQDFDKWVLNQEETPPFWAGLKFFNVYGPNEYHKGRMASVIFHTVNQIRATGGMKLFRSHNPKFKDGEQSRDFVYVRDVAQMIAFLFREKPQSGLYNVGTGIARTFYDLAKATFRAMDLEPNISFIDTPEDIRGNYQYFTQAKMEKIREAGYQEPFTSLEDGVTDYVQKYLLKGLIF